MVNMICNGMDIDCSVTHFLIVFGILDISVFSYEEDTMKLSYTSTCFCICNGCGMPAGNAYPSGHLVPSHFWDLLCAPVVETRFFELAMSLLDFSPWIPLGTFSISLLNFASIVLGKDTIYWELTQYTRLVNTPVIYFIRHVFVYFENT